MNFIVNRSVFCIIEVWQEQDISYLMSQIFRNRGDKVQNDTKQVIPKKEQSLNIPSKTVYFLTYLRLKNICCNYIGHSTQKIKHPPRMN